MKRTRRLQTIHTSIFKRMIALVLAILLSVTFIPGTKAMDVRAEMTFLTIKNNDTIIIDAGNDIGLIGIILKEWSADVKVISATSSKKSVVKIDSASLGYNSLNIIPKKAGTSKITVKAKDKGITKYYSFKVKTKKFKNPFKKLELNGKSYRNQVAGMNSTISLDAPKVTVKYKLAKNWKVVSKGKLDFGGYKISKLKNNKTYKVKKDDVKTVNVHLKNKKTKQEVSLCLYISNPSELPDEIPV